MVNDSTRVTIMLDGDIDRKLRTIQATRIRNEQKSVSFSNVLNDRLRKQLKL